MLPDAQGPTGCGKSRFVRYMAQRSNSADYAGLPRRLSAADLTGRYRKAAKPSGQMAP